MPYWEELRYNDPDEIEGPGDVCLPSTMHHMQAKAEVDLLIQSGALTVEEAETVMREWRAGDEVDDVARLRDSVHELESRGLIDGDDAERILERLSA